MFFYKNIRDIGFFLQLITMIFLLFLLIQDSLAESNITISPTLPPNILVKKYLYQGYVAYKRGDYEDAILNYNRVLEIDEENLDALSNLGFVYKKMKQYDNAIEYFDRVISIDPSYVTAYNGKGLIFFEQKRYNDAKKMFESALDVDSTYENARKNLRIVEQILITPTVVVTETIISTATPEPEAESVLTPTISISPTPEPTVSVEINVSVGASELMPSEIVEENSTEKAIQPDIQTSLTTDKKEISANQLSISASAESTQYPYKTMEEMKNRDTKIHENKRGNSILIILVISVIFLIIYRGNRKQVGVYQHKSRHWGAWYGGSYNRYGHYYNWHR